MLFRASDTESKGVIHMEDFRIFLSKIKLGLTTAQITKLIQIFDENWTGSIKKEDYMLTLAAFNVNSEKINFDSARSIGQETMLKFAKILNEKHYSPEEAFRLLDVRKRGSISIDDISDFLKKINGNIAKREQAALFSHLDSEQKGNIRFYIKFIIYIFYEF